MNSQPDLQPGKQQVLELMQSGRHEEAVTLLQSVCESMPGNAEARYLLGCSYVRLGRLQQAAEALQQSIRIRPDVAQSRLALAGTQRALGQLDAAVKHLEAALASNGAMPEAHVALAEILVLREDYIDARSHLEKALALNPGLSGIHVGLGEIGIACCDYEEAISHFEKAVELEPDSIPALCSLGSCLLNLGRNQEALVCFQRALDLDSGCIAALTGMAQVYEFEGDHEKAIHLIAPLIGRRERYVGVGNALARTCRHTGRCREAVEYINECLEQAAVHSSQRRTLHFAAGKVLDRMELYDEAFAHYKAANETMTHLYDAVGNAQRVDEYMRTFTRGLFMRMPRARGNDQRPVFIVGMPRSGTSLTEQILAAHPGVYGAGELATMNAIVHQVPREAGCRQSFAECVPQLGQADLDRLVAVYFGKLDEIAGEAERVTDKMPHNFFHLGLIQLLFPRARVIHCVRDPLDTCLSIYFQDFYKEHDYAKDLFFIGVHYHQYRRLMEHWKGVLSLPILDIRYEELVTDQEAETRRLLEFLDLEWDDNCLRFHESKRLVHTASYDQVRQPLYNRSVGRWRHYEKYLDDLKRGLERGH